MGSLSSFSTAWKRCLWFVLWGLVDGGVVYLVITLTWSAWLRGDILFAAGCAFCGGMISAVVFAVLSRFGPGWLAGGFVVVGALTPWLIVVVSKMLYCRCLDTSLDGLAFVAVLLWTLISLPFSLLSAIVFVSARAWSRTRDKRRAANV